MKGTANVREARTYGLRPATLRAVKRMRLLYLFLLVPAALVFVFNYIPIYGILIAFTDFRAADGVFGSPWNNFAHFKLLFNSFSFLRSLRNTLIISISRLILGFPAPILLAILINEVRRLWFKKTIQTISYLPHFMSWVVLASIMFEVFSPQRGIINYFLKLLGHEPIFFLVSKVYFVPILILSGIWQGVGYGSILFLAAISAIDPNLYEAAYMDGANRFQNAVYITIPALRPIIVILFILSLKNILDAGFDQIFNLYSPLVYEVADVLDTYVYRVGLLEFQYGFATAVGLFKNLVGLLLIIFTNTVVQRFSEFGVW